MMDKQTIKCPICGEPYNVYPYMVGGQSACPECRRKADQKDQNKRQYERC